MSEIRGLVASYLNRFPEGRVLLAVRLSGGEEVLRSGVVPGEDGQPDIDVVLTWDGLAGRYLVRSTWETYFASRKGLVPNTPKARRALDKAVDVFERLQLGDFPKRRARTALVSRRAARKEFYVPVKSLPDSIRRTLRQDFRYRKRDIEVIVSDKYWTGYAMEKGNQAVLSLVHLPSGMTKTVVGDFGGPNPWGRVKPVDEIGKHPLPPDTVAIHGERGGRGASATIYVRPDNTDWFTFPQSNIKLSSELKKALGVILSIKSSARRDEFRWLGLGEYSPDNPLILELAALGLVKITGSGIRPTTKGRDVYRSNVKR